MSVPRVLNWPKEKDVEYTDRKVEGMGRKEKIAKKLYGRYCTPQIAFLSELLVWVLGGTIVFSSFFAVTAFDDPADQWSHLIAYIAGGLIVNMILYRAGLYRFILAFLIGPTLRVIVAPNGVWISGWFKYKFYEGTGRTLEFRIEEDGRAIKEKDRMQRMTRAAQQHAKAYYGSTIQVVLRYGEKRVVLASIYNNPEKAGALVKRLQTTVHDMTGG